MLSSENERDDEVVGEAGEGFLRGRSIGIIMRVGGHRGRGRWFGWFRALCAT